MLRDLTTAIILSIAVLTNGCGKDIENPDFPTSLKCALETCPPVAKPAPIKPLSPPATVVRPNP